MKSIKDNTEILFDIYSSDMQEYLQNRYGRNRDLKKYRTKVIESGNMLEVEIYPIWNTRGKANESIKKAKKNKEHTANVNHRNRQKNVIRQINDNFNEKDIWITLGYKRAGDTSKQIISKDKAKKDMENYIRRLRGASKRLGYPPLKYIYAIEQHKNGSAHIHMIVNFSDRDMAESLWNEGDYPQARRLAVGDFGLTGLAKYITKDCINGNRYYSSKNLTKPWKTAKTYDNRVSKLKCKRLITGEIDNKEYFEKEYEKYKFLDMDHKTSSFIDGYYLYIRMNRETGVTNKRE